MEESEEEANIRAVAAPYVVAILLPERGRQYSWYICIAGSIAICIAIGMAIGIAPCYVAGDIALYIAGSIWLAVLLLVKKKILISHIRSQTPGNLGGFRTGQDNPSGPMRGISNDSSTNCAKQIGRHRR
ncbi:hypothetical protein BGX38DRAFT_1213732 [Terfezia claveryi]|nr:hypothetical protein BGX38DRAFT_1213732 [Terfezia claveryi]